MKGSFDGHCWARWGLPLLLGSAACSTSAAVRDGGIDPANLGKGDWIYYMSDATNRLGANVASVTNETSLMLFYKNQGIRYLIVKAATSDQLFNGDYTTPQFTSNLVQIAHDNGLLIFGYNRSYGSNITAEIAISDYVFRQGADGFVWDAESEWESNQTWISTNGPGLAWALCSSVRSNWPNKFLAHAPFPVISLHSSFPYKEFGYWSDAVMPQIYPQGWTAIYSRPSGGINWSDANWAKWQRDVASLPPTNLYGRTIYWTNAIKPLAPVNHVYGPNPPNSEVSEIAPEFVMEFVDYLNADPNAQTAGGYQGANFWRADLHGVGQWTNIGASTIGNFPSVVNNIVMDNLAATNVGAWTSVRTFYCSANLQSAMFAGDGSGTDTNSFGTNYLVLPQGVGSNYCEFTPNIIVPGDYNVWQWHPFRAEASAGVPFLVAHGKGTTTVWADQTTNAGKWSLLGRYFFPPGKTASIRVSDAIAGGDRIVMVDGIKLTFVPPAAAPTAPIRLRAMALSTSEITLVWTNTATNAAMFVLNRALASGGPYTAVGAVPGTTNRYTDTNLLASTTYYYRVTATNFLGSATCSTTASATTWALTSIAVVGDGSLGQQNVPAGCSSVIAISAGDWHSLALRDDGRVFAWGWDAQGQCQVPANLTDALAIAAGGYHGLAIRSDGTVAAWGDNSYGQIAVPSACSDVIAIAAGTWHSLALRKDGTVLAWGDNSCGQTTLPSGLSGVVAIAAGGNHSLALKADNTVVAWGDNTDAEGRFSGQSVVPWGLSNVVGIAAGQYHSLAIKADGAVITFGDSSYGQCSVPLGLTGVVAIAGGGLHTVALQANGRVLAWGEGASGQCLLSTNLTNCIAVAAGQVHTVILGAAVVPVPRLLQSALHAQQFQTVIQTLYRRNYVLEYRATLDAGTWTSLPAVPGNGALRLLTDPGTPAPQRFYRVRQW